MKFGHCRGLTQWLTVQSCACGHGFNSRLLPFFTDFISPREQSILNYYIRNTSLCLLQCKYVMVMLTLLLLYISLYIALLFALAGFYQMTVWAQGKHRRYCKEFKDYPRGRKAIVPFII